jgi:L-amino acid N-acyltransferase YncA
MDALTVRAAEATDATVIARIYNHYIANTIVTFEEEPVSDHTMTVRVAETLGASLPWLVAEHDGVVVGYAYASKWKERVAYRHSVETTIYLDQTRTGRGIGMMLYSELLSRLPARGLHAAIGGIALPNKGSIALHEKLGFRHVGTFRQVGFKQDRWVDVGYWEVLL